MKHSLKKWHIPFLLLLVLGTYFILKRHHVDDNAPYQQNQGNIFGTIYHSTYQYPKDLEAEIQSTLNEVDNSLSMFNSESTISRINSNTSENADSLLERVFLLSQRISKETNGAFDVTVAPLVNAWGFGFKHDTPPDSTTIDSLKSLIGWDRVHLDNGKMTKEDERIIMDFSAIAKGFGSDRVAELFERKGIKNYMIEIGGEVVTRGNSPKGKPWRIGINKPENDSTLLQNEIEQVLQIPNCALATSGNYRNFYYKDGKKVAHTIDPKTGYPVQHSILSSTVLAPTCAEADGFATSFMVLGLEKAKEVLNRNPQLKAYFIYADETGNYQIWHSPSLSSFLLE